MAESLVQERNITITEAEHQEILVSRELGFWFYLMSDGVIFALLFATYITLRHNTAGGPEAQQLFKLGHTLAETAALLTSSLTCGFATWAAAYQRRSLSMVWLLVTLALGLLFVSLEISEFHHLIDIGAGPARSGFLSAFFTLIATHGVHVCFGMLWLLMLLIQLPGKGTSPWVISRLNRWGMFWHFLDIVWVGIFSFVYLPGVLR
jgi:cytochrome o ubiquinol oxidase subunit III